MVRTAGRYLRPTHARSMHSTSGVCVCCSAWHQMVPICTEWWCTEANKATQTHCYNPVSPAYPIWAYYAHGRQRRCQEDPVSLPSSRLEKTTIGVPASRGSAPSNRIWNNTTLSPKQQIWLRTALCGGWCRRMALRNRELHARNDDAKRHSHIPTGTPLTGA